MKHGILVSFSIAAVVTLFLLCGCSGSASVRVENGHGTLAVRLTDAPLDLADVQSVNVTLTGVIVYPREEMGSSLSDPAGTNLRPIVLLTHPATFDLLTLTGGATALLASGEVPAGDYERIRLEVSDATLIYKDGTSEPLKIDSNKVDVPIPFHVLEGAETGVTLDFDAGASVQVNETGNGKLILRPVVTPVSVTP
jgi:hypothetical protein